jgi:5-methylcytosine-specific restriction endonuclease McrA
MTFPCSKRPRLHLDRRSYRILRERILQRDAWRCQHCGCRSGLQVHHIRSRSLLGDDADENLITLCARCHKQVHLRMHK